VLDEFFYAVIEVFGIGALAGSLLEGLPEHEFVKAAALEDVVNGFELRPILAIVLTGLMRVIRDWTKRKGVGGYCWQGKVMLVLVNAL
jgi:hypothetical protein